MTLLLLLLGTPHQPQVANTLLTFYSRRQMEFGESRPVLPSALQDLTTGDDFLSEIRRPSLPGTPRASSRGNSMCCRESAAVLLGKAVAFPPVLHPASSPTERKYQRVLLKQCGFNLRGVRAFKTATQFLPQSLRSSLSLAL